MSIRNLFSEMSIRSRSIARGPLLGFCVALLLVLFAFNTSALAQSKPLDAPRAAGLIGERYDGYAVVRGNASADISALVDSTNAQRRAVYAEQAKSQGAPVDAIGKIYAAEIMKSAPAGTWFLSESGQWRQR